MKKYTLYDSFPFRSAGLKQSRLVYLQDPEKRAEKQESEESPKSALGVFIEHAKLSKSLKDFIGEHKESPNENIRKASERADEELKRIEHDNPHAERNYFLGDEKFKARILKDIEQKLNGMEEDVSFEQKKDKLENTKKECTGLAATEKLGVQSYWKNKTAKDERLIGLDKEAKKVVDDATNKAIKEQTDYIDKVVAGVKSLKLEKNTPSVEYDAIQFAADAAIKNLQGEGVEYLKTKLDIIEGFENQINTQSILSIAREFDKNKVVKYFFDEFKKGSQALEDNSELTSDEKNTRHKKLDALKAEWLGGAKGDKDKGKFFGALAPFSNKDYGVNPQEDAKNRAYVLTELADKINRIVKGDENYSDASKSLMASLKDNTTRKAARELASYQYVAGVTKEDAKNWPSDREKAKKSQDAYATFAQKSREVYALRMRDKNEKEQKILPTGQKPEENEPVLVAKANPKKGELPEKTSTRKAA